MILKSYTYLYIEYPTVIDILIQQISQKLTYKQKRVLIDDLAYWMIKNGYVSFNSRQAIDRINVRLPNMHGYPD